MRQSILPFVLFLALVALFWFVLDQMNTGTYHPRDIPSPQIGKKAPNFSLPSLYDPDIQVSPTDYLGKTWLLNVWGTWCPECWREHAFLMIKAEQGIPIVGLNWRDKRADALHMLYQLGDPFVQIAFDPESQAVIEWGVYGAPETFLIDAQGIIRGRYKGALGNTAWRNHFAPYFANKSAVP